MRPKSRHSLRQLMCFAALLFSAALTGCAEYQAGKAAVKEIYSEVREERAELRVDKFTVARNSLCETDPLTVADLISKAMLDLEAFARVCPNTYGRVFDKARGLK